MCKGRDLVARCVLRADATGHGAVLTQRVAYAEAHHGILVLGTLGQVGQELANDLEGVAVVEVVAVDDAERLLDDVLTHQHGVVRAPRLLAAFGHSEALGQCVECLEAQLALHLTFVLC